MDEIPPPPPAYSEMRLMAGNGRLSIMTGAYGQAVLFGFDGWQFFTPWLYGGLTGSVGPLTNGTGGFAMVGPVVGVTAPLWGPFRGWAGASYALGGSSAIGRLSTFVAPEIGLAYSLGNSSRIGLSVSGLFADNGQDRALVVSLSFGTRHAIAYAQDTGY